MLLNVPLDYETFSHVPCCIAIRKLMQGIPVLLISIPETELLHVLYNVEPYVHYYKYQ